MSTTLRPIKGTELCKRLEERKAIDHAEAARKYHTLLWEPEPSPAQIAAIADATAILGISTRQVELDRETVRRYLRAVASSANLEPLRAREESLRPAVEEAEAKLKAAEAELKEAKDAQYAAFRERVHAEQETCEAQKIRRRHSSFFEGRPPFEDVRAPQARGSRWHRFANEQPDF